MLFWVRAALVAVREVVDTTVESLGAVLAAVREVFGATVGSLVAVLGDVLEVKTSANTGHQTQQF